MKNSTLRHTAFSSALIIVAGLLVVNSDLHAATSGKAGKRTAVKTKTDPFEKLIAKLAKEGFEDDVLGGSLRRDLGISETAKTNGDDAVAEEIADFNGSRTCILINEVKPRSLVFNARSRSGQDSESYYFRTGLSGILERAFVQHGKYDSNGKPVRGSAVVAQLDVNSPDVKKRLQRELDFWLYGKGRKKARLAEQAPLTPKPAGSQKKP